MLLKVLLLFSDVNKFSTFYKIFPDSFFCSHSSKEPVMSPMNKQWITYDFWISSALMFVVSFLLGVMICSGKQRMTGQVVMVRTDP